jgi:CheY-like chemotaxis protein
MDINYSIIITDDDLDDQEFLIIAIKKIMPGCVINTANNGSELLDMLLKKNAFQGSAQSLPNLIILDLNMPLVDGYNVLKEIKGNNELKHIPVFILTTSNNEYDHIKSIAYGAKAFYSKPMAASELLTIVKAIFSHASIPGKNPEFI